MFFDKLLVDFSGAFELFNFLKNVVIRRVNLEEKPPKVKALSSNI